MTGRPEPRSRRRWLALTLVFLAAPWIDGCALLLDGLILMERIGSLSEHRDPPSLGPVVDSLSEDARFVAAQMASCPIEETRITHRTRRRFRVEACGRVIVLRCRVPPDGSPTRCREVHPPETVVAVGGTSVAPEGSPQ